jgi:SAM-dependent methyltransferase
MRHRLDRTRPPVPTPEPAAEPGATDTRSVPSEYFHQALHELRTIELERVPKGARRALSVGASGGWYFDWFERSVGPLESHIGVEAFETEPDDLPPYATWIASTADRFDEVPDDSVDLVFAGQTTEHLWPDELTGFLLESHRVLAEGGQLVIDSPNRLVTEHLDWSHGGHTIELSAAETNELLELAGFEVTSTRGLWLCRIGDRVLELEEGLDDGGLTCRRICDAAERPDDSFVWWINAVRRALAPDPAALAAQVEALFDQHWNTRVSRGMWPGPGSDEPFLGGDGQSRIASLPFMIRPGTWTLSVSTRDEDADVAGMTARIALPGGNALHELGTPDVVEGRTARWAFHQDALALAVSIEVVAPPTARPATIVMPVGLTPDGW